MSSFPPNALKSLLLPRYSSVVFGSLAPMGGNPLFGLSFISSRKALKLSTSLKMTVVVPATVPSVLSRTLMVAEWVALLVVMLPASHTYPVLSLRVSLP